jgi:predicted MPP superfamily phosphohydrolase
MDTIPFHLILLAVDVLVLGGLFLWIRHRRNSGQSRSVTYEYEKSLFVPTVKVRKPSLLWDLSGCVLCGGFGFVCFAVFSRIIFTDTFQKHVYNFNVGQCIIEGFFYHGTMFFFAAGAMLFWNRRHLTAVCSVFAGVCLISFAADILWYEPYALVAEHYTIKTPKLKKPLRVVFVADIQTDRIGWYEEKTLKKIKSLKGDLIIFGGDYLQVFAGTPHADKLPEAFRQLFIKHKLEAPLGVYAITGNIHHATATDADLFKDTGVEAVMSSTVLENLGSDKDLGPIDVVLLGLGASRGNAGEPKELTDTGNFMIMAGHYPNFAIHGYKSGPPENYAKPGYMDLPTAPDLMLAGHTHGGQAGIPFYGPLPPWFGDSHVKQTPREMMHGFFQYANGGRLLVSRGSGMERGWAPRFRFCCPSEISVIDLVPE